MLNSLWKQVVGDQTSPSASEYVDNAALSTRKNPNTNPNTVDEDDRLAESLLSQFPPFGTFSQARRQSMQLNSDVGIDDEYDNVDASKGEDPLTDEEDKSSWPYTLSADNTSQWRKQGRRVSNRIQLYSPKVDDDDEDDLKSISSQKSLNASVVSTGNVLNVIGDDNRVANEKKYEKSQIQKNVDPVFAWGKNCSDWADDDEMALWNARQKKKTNDMKDSIHSKRRKKRRRKKKKDKKSRVIFYWEKRKEWIEEGPANFSTLNSSKQKQLDLPNPQNFSAPSVGATTVSSSTFEDIFSPKQNFLNMNSINQYSDDDSDTYWSETVSSTELDENESISSGNASQKEKLPANSINHKSLMININQSCDDAEKKIQIQGNDNKDTNMKHIENYYYDEKQHWMPDKMCKTCYSCEVPFSVFRRRHHCRVCGQVFCSTCSAHFAEIGYPSTVDQQNTINSGEKKMSLFLEKVASVKLGNNSTTSTSANNATLSKSNNSSDTNDNAFAQSSFTSTSNATGPGSVRTIRTCKMCFEQLSVGGSSTLLVPPLRQKEEKQETVSNETAKDRGGILKRRVPNSNILPVDKKAIDEPSPNATSKHIQSFPKANVTSNMLPSLPASRSETSAPTLKSKFFPYKNELITSKKNENEVSGSETSESNNSTRIPSSDVLISTNITKQLAGYDGSGLNDDFHNLTMVKKKLDEERIKRELKEKEEARLAEAAKIEAELQNQSLNQKLMIGKRISSTVSRRFGRLAEQAAREAQVGDTGFCDEETKLVGTGVKAPDEKEAEKEFDQSIRKNKTSFPDLSIEEADMIRVNELSSSEDLGKKSGDVAISPTDDEKNETKTRNIDLLRRANIDLGKIAADHLERMGRELLQSEAPMLIQNKCENLHDKDAFLDCWVDKLMILATRCCATVEPNVKEGDLLDIRPYCKIKVIPGGSLHDSAYMSGIIFHKNVSHKSMAKEIYNPRIMLLSGGIEYTRMENRIASLDTLLEQEEKYMEILVTKIIKLKPDILMAGRSVSRKAQELLLKANIVLIQHVKSSLMKRIARQTGATILSSIDHIMNQFGSSVLGKSNRFRLVAFRDNEIWNDKNYSTTMLEEQTDKNYEKKSLNTRSSMEEILSNKDVPNHKRQAALAANSLGESVHDGCDVVVSGLAKRGVTNTYVMVEGCPKHLGCTVVLRGANCAALKQVKRVFRFLVNVAYNLKLETSFLRDRRARLPPDYLLPTCTLASSSLCIDYGDSPSGKRARPWNGGNDELINANRSTSGKITAFDHQSILITSVWMTGKTQCCPAEVKGICYYSQQDVSLGQFLRDSCFNLSLKCQNPSCTKSVLDHSLSFVHNDGLINITVEQMEKPLPPGPGNYTENDGSTAMPSEKNSTSKNVESPIATWTYCNICNKVVSPLIYISEETWKLSFGKFLEVCFYNKSAILNAPEYNCSCSMQKSSVLYFGCGELAARFTYEPIRPHGVYVRRFLPENQVHHKEYAVRQLEVITSSSSDLFVRLDKHIEGISRDARQLFGSSVNTHEHLQTILSELNVISSEVDHASKILQEKISSVTNKIQDLCFPVIKESKRIVYIDTLLRFPWHCRRYLFMLASAWNDRLSAVGQTLGAMKKIAASSPYSGVGGRADIGQNVVPSIVGDGSTEDVSEAMRRLLQLREIYSKFNLDEMSIRPHNKDCSDKDDHNRSRHQKKGGDSEHFAVQEELNYDDDIGGESGGQLDSEFNFSEEIDADVLASRRRYAQKIESSTRRRSSVRSSNHRRSNDSDDDHNDSRQRQQRNSSLNSRMENLNGSQSNTTKPNDTGSKESSFSKSPTPQQNKVKAVSAGGAMKSALTRLFNRGNKELDPYVVDLGVFSEGRPKLEPGIDGSVVPVMDEQPSTIIAHSLSSIEYDAQFKQFVKSDGVGLHDSAGGGEESPNDNFLTGRIDLDSSNRSSKQDRRGGRIGIFPTPLDERKEIERKMLVRSKTHIKHTFRDYDEKGQQLCKFVCTTYWATQFQAVRQAFMSSSAFSDLKEAQIVNESLACLSAEEVERSYVRSLSASQSWAASGGKSGASFARTGDGRFVVKSISRTELQMFLDCAPAYFEYLTKAFFHGLPTVLCKIVGVYQIGYHNRVTGKRTMEQVAVMQNIFFQRTISKVFDLKGSLRGRFSQQPKTDKDKISNENSVNDSLSNHAGSKHTVSSRNLKNQESGDLDGHLIEDECDDNEDAVENTCDSSDEVDDSAGANDVEKKVSSSLDISTQEISKEPSNFTQLDGDFLEFTAGRPLPLNDRAKAVFHMSILNDTLFLSIINVLDYSILIGIDEEKNELVVGIIDFMRQYDILKQMERVGKSIPMVVGSEAPTIIQPPLYKARFTNAMERYFMTVPSKWTVI